MTPSAEQDVPAGKVDSINNRVLIIDDMESIHQDYRKSLLGPSHDAEISREADELFGPSDKKQPGRTFDLDSALQGQEGLAKLKEAANAGRPYAVAFVDMRMPPGWDGVQTIEQLWKVDPRLQVVICTAYADYSWDQVTRQLGASDRLLILKKPFDTAEVRQLAIALTEKWEMTRHAGLKLNQLERLVMERTAELRHQATHDHLTGLPNRAGLSDRLRQTLERTRAGHGRFAMLFLDFDRFKVINDSLGHEFGDQLLIHIARRLRAVLGETGVLAPSTEVTAARLGGDEFVILVDAPDADEQAVPLANRVLAALRPAYDLLGHEVFSTASIGITTSEFDYCRPEDVLRDADTAMYRAKTSGKDCYVIFDSSLHDQTRTRLQMETDLRKAVDNNEFDCVYQPIVSLRTAEIAGFETLIRWSHPQRGAISPGDFVPVAEDTGLILPIGKWILRRAVRQLVEWRKLGGADSLFVAVNLSKRQVLEPGLARMVGDLLKETGLPPSRLKLEVTESIIMGHGTDTLIPILKSLKDLGIQLWMDDFGTGHSSLSCMHSFPLDGLKIDQAFVRNLDTSKTYAAVVQAIVLLARNLGLTVLIEGVETSQQLTQVIDLDCEYGQGWLFSQPLATADCLPLVRRPRVSIPFPSSQPEAA